MSDAIVEVQDRLLERPMAYSVPVAGEFDPPAAEVEARG